MLKRLTLACVVTAWAPQLAWAVGAQEIAMESKHCTTIGGRTNCIQAFPQDSCSRCLSQEKQAKEPKRMKK